MHVVVGRQGSGKTLLLVYKAYEGYLQGKTIYSNVHLNFPYKQLNYEDIIECRLKNAIVIIDEIHQLLPARFSASNKVSQKICDGFVSQLRKQDLELYGSTQFQRKVDIRIREEKDYFYICTRYVYLNGVWIEAKHTKEYAPSIPVLIKVEVQDQYSMDWIQYSMMANQVYGLYDKNQIIKVRGLEKYK